MPEDFEAACNEIVKTTESIQNGYLNVESHLGKGFLHGCLIAGTPASYFLVTYNEGIPVPGIGYLDDHQVAMMEADSLESARISFQEQHPDARIISVRKHKYHLKGLVIKPVPVPAGETITIGQVV